MEIFIGILAYLIIFSQKCALIATMLTRIWKKKLCIIDIGSVRYYIHSVLMIKRVKIMMKRSFAAAAAVATLIAGSANAAEDFKVGLSGFINAGFLASDVDSNTVEYDATSIRTDNLVNFTGSTVLDNGLRVSAVAGFSLSQGNSGSSSTDDLYQEELFIEVGGSFGDVRLGRARNAGALLHSYIPSAGVGTFAVDDARTNAFVGGSTSTATSLGQAEYANRITYFTPRIEGVQLAASFTPETNTNHNPSLDGFNRFGGTAAQTKNEYSLAGNYSREVAGLGVVGSVGYTASEAPASNSISAVRDSEALHAGLALSYADFTFGGAWGKYEDPRAASGSTQTYGAGVKYVTGPWGFGASGMVREASNNATAAFMTDGQNSVEKQYFYELGATYALGSGVTTGAGVYYNDNVDPTGATGAPQDSIAGVVNLSVAF